MGETPLLQLNHLSVQYGGIQALHDVSLHVASGEIVTLIGANGAGKTSCLRAISGLIAPAQGSMQWMGQDLRNRDAAQRVRLGLAHSPEGRMVLAQQSVEDNLKLGSFVHRADKVGCQQSLDEVFQLFPRLRERRAQSAGTLSGGEQQMLAMGRALMARPKLLLLDEPSLGLAPLVVAEIFDRMRGMNAQGMALLLVEQNAQLALRLAQRAYVLESGRIVLEGKAQELLHDSRVKAAYLGA
ncbi:MAG TPA: ABC transporter ATP-binding protein [Oligoflexus sp.]|uniref:ABC transporter ATP-binding protein n=1 Tax=Oligoflexus sp. TaxID=1971216 RepID=UPI002D61C328|nr:ABC transporter ATP-binding protein [Oligoflexus sp.]HYX34480.1 ABC transporter ATP-binding protein [Oligoflexus sp.]